MFMVYSIFCTLLALFHCTHFVYSCCESRKRDTARQNVVKFSVENKQRYNAGSLVLIKSVARAFGKRSLRGSHSKILEIW